MSPIKIIKLAATARAKVEFLRANPSFYPHSDLRSPSDSYIVNCADKFLLDIEFWTKSSMEPTVIQTEYSDLFGSYSEGSLILYQDSVYVVQGEVTPVQRRLLVLEAADKERQLFERLKAKFDSPGGNAGTRARHRIPEAVRIEVWRRDQGRCATPGCGSREDLEYDHIVPIDAGGSNTVRNVELLCEACNRRKSNKIQ